MVESSGQTCVNHPERAAVEHCEVCGNPLCAYCLYYTSDGQRLCKTHAEEAQAAGAFISAPGAYAGGLIGAQISAQVSADRSAKGKNSDHRADRALYEANNADVLGFVGLLLGVCGVAICLPGIGCLLSPVGIIISLFALITAKEAHNPRRTRQMAGIGIGLSILWTAVAILCISTLFSQVQLATKTFGNLQVTVNAQIYATVNARSAIPTNTAPIPTLAAPSVGSPTALIGR